MSNDWAQLAEELHKPIVRKFPKRRVIITGGINNTWSADLVEIPKLSNWNKGNKYLLTIIDVFSKYAWVKPLKNKLGKTVTNAFNDVIKESLIIPKYLWTDKGSEFYNQHFKSMMKTYGITLYSTENEEKVLLLRDSIEHYNQ